MMTRKKRVVRRMSMTLLPDTLVTRDLSTLAMLRQVPTPLFLLELYLTLALNLVRKGGSLYSQVGVNLVESIKKPRKCEASRDVLDAFSGPPKKKCDPDHIRLKGTGRGMAQRVFNPAHVWQTKDANAFMAKNLTLIPEQKQELE